MRTIENKIGVLIEEFFGMNQSNEFIEIDNNNFRKYKSAIEKGKRKLPEFNENDPSDFIGAYLLINNGEMVDAFEWQLSNSHNYFESFTNTTTRGIIEALPEIVSYIRSTEELPSEIFISKKLEMGLSLQELTKMLPPKTKLNKISRYSHNYTIDVLK